MSIQIFHDTLHTKLTISRYRRWNRKLRWTAPASTNPRTENQPRAFVPYERIKLPALRPCPEKRSFLRELYEKIANARCGVSRVGDNRDRSHRFLFRIDPYIPWLAANRRDVSTDLDTTSSINQLPSLGTLRCLSIARWIDIFIHFLCGA